MYATEEFRAENAVSVHGSVRLDQRLFYLLIPLLLIALAAVLRCSSWITVRGNASLKRAALDLIAAWVAVHDPCAPRLARLGPAAGALPNGEEYTRIETVLAKPRSIAGWPHGQVALAQAHNERIIYSLFPFRYQPWGEARLEQLRTKYQLDQVIAAAADEFEAMVLLRNWTRSQFRRSDYQPETQNFDALTVLDRNLRNHTNAPCIPGKHLDPCHFFPCLYCQIMLSMGHQARLVSIGHGMAEVWSNQYEKWVSMDVELNLHYEKNGVPLNMMDVYEENYGEKPSQVRIVRGQQWSGDPSTTRVYLGIDELPVESMIKYHYQGLTLVDLRNDWVTNHYFPGHPARSEQNSLTYADPRASQAGDRAPASRPRTNRKEDLYWTLNQTEILARETAITNPLPLAFQTVTPNFDHFEITIDGTRSLLSTVRAFDWQLHEGLNTLSVRTVNQYGVQGIVSSAQLRVTAGGD